MINECQFDVFDLPLSRRHINRLIFYQKSCFSPKFEYFSFQLSPESKSSTLVVYMLHPFAFFLSSSFGTTQKNTHILLHVNRKNNKKQRDQTILKSAQICYNSTPSIPTSLVDMPALMAGFCCHTYVYWIGSISVGWLSFRSPIVGFRFFSPSLDIFYYTNSSKFTNIECHASLRTELFFIPRMGLWTDYERGWDGLFFLYSDIFCELTFVYNFIDMWTHVLIHDLSGKECGFF